MERPAFDEKLAASYVGKYILVGLTWMAVPEYASDLRAAARVEIRRAYSFGGSPS
jgi:hypothetical protein